MTELLDPIGLTETAHHLEAASSTLTEAEIDARQALRDAADATTSLQLEALLRGAVDSTTRLAADLRVRADGSVELDRREWAGVAIAAAPTPQAPPATITDRHRRLHRQWHRLEHQKAVLHGASPEIVEAINEALSARQAALTHGFDRSDWTAMALLEADIAVDRWVPAAGLSHNEETVVAIYEYYGRLWLDNPDLEWAAMATLAGSMLYAGWQDVRSAQQVAESPVAELLAVLPLPGVPQPIEWILDRTPAVAELGAAELAHLERVMLSMQQQVFLDMGWQHTAYQWGGVPALVDAGLSDARVAPWRLIDSGDALLVHLGNAALLHHEQRFILQDDFDALRSHRGPVGEAITDFLTWGAESPVPGGRAYRDVVTYRIEIPMIAPQAPALWPPTQWIPVEYEPIEVHVPRGNLADFDDRWEWITVDMIPAMLRLLRDPVAATELIETPVPERAARQRRLG